MKGKSLIHTLDSSKPSKLAAKQALELRRLQQQTDESIDYTDIAPLSNEFWRNAVQNPLYKPTKSSTTIRLDSDVLLWLKSHGKGYQTRLNQILRQAMMSELTTAAVSQTNVSDSIHKTTR